MRINEVDDSANQAPSAEKLMGLVSFLDGRSQDTTAKKQISQDAFINMAQQLGVHITPQQLADLTLLPPLSNVLEPLTPGSTDPIVYKGGEPESVAMPVNKAQDIVAKAAKSAARKDRGI
jgi:hypothetical protein